MLLSNIPMFYAWNPDTREPAGTVEGIAAEPPDVGYYPPPCSCGDAPPIVGPAGKRCVRNADNTAWIFVDAADQRRLAYEAEADSIREEARLYEDRAAVQRRLGNSEAATLAESREMALLEVWAAKIEEIQGLYPDPESPEEQPEVDNTGQNTNGTEDLYSLSNSGTYHMAGCSYVSAGSALMNLIDINITNPQAKPCSRCNPPAMESTNE